MYEYQCGDCGQRFERLSWGSAGPVRCGCGSEKAERIWFSRVAMATGTAAAEGCGEGACLDDGGEGCCGGGACGMDGFDN